MKVYEPATETGMEQNQLDELVELSRTMMVVIPHRIDQGLTSGLASAVGSWTSLGLTVYPVEDNFGGFVEFTRAGIVRNFLNFCAEHPAIDKCVMIDADENMTWQAPFQLARWDLDIVSGVVCSYRPGVGAVACFTVPDRYGVPRFPSAKHSGKLPTKGLLSVHSVGSGLICVKRKVFEAILADGKQPFEVPPEVRRTAFETGILKLGEDMSFCRQARETGHKIWVDLAVHAVHYKTLAVCWPSNALDDQMAVGDFKVDLKDHYHG